MTLSVVATSDLGASSPRVRLDVTSGTGGPLPVPVNSTVALMRTHPDGSVHQVLTTANQRLIGGFASIFDYHAPFGVPSQYAAIAAGQTSAAVTVSLVVSSTWLIHASNPALSVQPKMVTAFGDSQRKSTAVAYVVYGSPTPVFRNTGVRRSIEAAVTVSIDRVNIPAFETILDDSGPLLFNGVGVGMDHTWAWIQPGDTGRSNPAGQFTQYKNRQYTLPFTVVSQPVVDMFPLYTIANTMDAYATINAVKAAFPTANGWATGTVGS